MADLSALKNIFGAPAKTSSPVASKTATPTAVVPARLKPLQNIFGDFDSSAPPAPPAAPSVLSKIGGGIMKGIDAISPYVPQFVKVPGVNETRNAMTFPVSTPTEQANVRSFLEKSKTAIPVGPEPSVSRETKLPFVQKTINIPDFARTETTNPVLNKAQDIAAYIGGKIRDFVSGTTEFPEQVVNSFKQIPEGLATGQIAPSKQEYHVPSFEEAAAAQVNQLSELGLEPGKAAILAFLTQGPQAALSLVGLDSLIANGLKSAAGGVAIKASEVAAARTEMGLAAEATAAEREAAFRDLVKQVHPDVGGNQQAFERLVQANKLLQVYEALTPLQKAAGGALEILNKPLTGEVTPPFNPRALIPETAGPSATGTAEATPLAPRAAQVARELTPIEKVIAAPSTPGYTPSQALENIQKDLISKIDEVKTQITRAETPLATPATPKQLELPRTAPETPIQTPAKAFQEAEAVPKITPIGKTPEGGIAPPISPALPAKAPIEHLGPVKPAKLAIDTMQRAIEKKLISEAIDIPHGATMNMKDQARMAAEFITREPERAMRVARGLENAPGELRNASVYKAMEVKILQGGEGDIRDLIRSGVGTELKAHGQEIKAADAGITDSPVTAMKSLVKEREAAVEKKLGKGKTVAKAKKEIVDEIKKTIPPHKPGDWEGFIKSIQCV